jgi:hypothetical protein
VKEDVALSRTQPIRRCVSVYRKRRREELRRRTNLDRCERRLGYVRYRGLLRLYRSVSPFRIQCYIEPREILTSPVYNRRGQNSNHNNIDRDNTYSRPVRSLKMSEPLSVYPKEKKKESETYDSPPSRPNPTSPRRILNIQNEQSFVVYFRT